MATAIDRIEKKPDVCGGDACIRNSRITVWGLVEWKRLGFSDDEIRSRIPNLTQEELDAAWDYHATHAQEIDEAIRLNQEA